MSATLPPATKVVGRIEPKPARPERDELIGLLVGAEAELANCTDRIGALYRRGLVRRIRDVIAREKKYLGIQDKKERQ